MNLFRVTIVIPEYNLAALALVRKFDFLEEADVMRSCVMVRNLTYWPSACCALNGLSSNPVYIEMNYESKEEVNYYRLEVDSFVCRMKFD